MMTYYLVKDSAYAMCMCPVALDIMPWEHSLKIQLQYVYRESYSKWIIIFHLEKLI